MATAQLALRNAFVSRLDAQGFADVVRPVCQIEAAPTGSRCTFIGLQTAVANARLVAAFFEAQKSHPYAA